jgi:hypothetical protein
MENIEGTKIGIKMSYDKDKLDRSSEIDGTRLGFDIAKAASEKGNKQ